MSRHSRLTTTRRAGVRLTVVTTASLLVTGTALLLAIRLDWVRDVGATLVDTHLGWLAAALVAQTFSIGSLAHQQRRLLTVCGNHPLPLPSVVATTYVGGALSLSLPIVGKAAAAVYSYRRFTAHGLKPAMVSWALVMSAVYLTLAFLTVSAIGTFSTGSAEGIAVGILTVAGVVVPAVVILGALHHARVRHRIHRAIDRAFAWLQRATRRPWPQTRRRVHTAVHIAATARLGVSNLLTVAAWSLANMAATLTAFVLSILAVGGDATWSVIVITWAAAFGAGQLGLIPGGIGIVDTALTVGLVAAGIPTTTAIAATLLYRIISFWLTAVAGSIAFVLSPRMPRMNQSLPDPITRTPWLRR